MRRLLFFALAIGICISGYPQQLKEYRSEKNPHYWQNRKPDKEYWQQDVYYKIDATIDEVTHVIHASQEIEYWNNSPDTLRFVYFHLFQNAFVKGSYLHKLEEQHRQKARLGNYEAAGLGTVVENIRVNGRKTRTELDNTVLKVFLPEPLYPGKYVSFSMDFQTYFDNGGSTRRRMKMYPAWGFMHYNGVQWFPKLRVYDRKLGWDTYQHLNKEFYADFGIYDVTLDFASNYIVEATGELMNRKEVLPDTLREKLDLKNFAQKPWNEPPSVVIPYKKEERKKWRFRAENVHDFAFTADPSYRMSTVYWNGIECVGLAQEPHASGWQNSAAYVAEIIKTFSEDFGPYAYPKMIAADAADGMEYPMLTLDGGSDPGYRGLLVHEIGHNWFYGMVGSNETYRAALDEGFTQFLTAWGLEKIDGEYLVKPPLKSKYKNRFMEPEKARDARVYNGYYIYALRGDEVPLNTHSNDFNDALRHEGGYAMVYYKTGAMLYNLQYTLGDSLFQAAMRQYFNQWKFAHPYFEDFKTSVIRFTKVDLNWFFDQWFTTTKTIDYKVTGIRKIKRTDSVEIKFKRNGKMQMPIDFTVNFRNGTQKSFHIPNTWFTKQTDAAILPKWYGWSKINPDYIARIQAPSKVKTIIIDTSDRLADIYPLDNRFSKGFFTRARSLKVKADPGFSLPPDRGHYRLWVRPDLWWNAVDGIKAGMHAEGSYLNIMHKIQANIWWNTHALQTDSFLSYKSEGWYDRYLPFNFTFSYQSPVSIFHPKHEEVLELGFLDGLAYGKFGHLWKPKDETQAFFYFKIMRRPHQYDFDYLIYPYEWSSYKDRINLSFNIELSRKYKNFKSFGSSDLSFRTPFLTGNEPDAFNYTYVQLNHVHTMDMGKLELRTRFFGRIGMGNQIPYESALWLAGANPEEMADNKFTRSVGFVPDDWRGISRYETNHFQMGGGLNLRGYAGYFIADERNGETYIGYKGRSGAAVNVELDVDRYIKLNPRFTRNWLHVDVYGFADGGFIELSKISDVKEYYNSIPSEYWSDFRMDAGLGFAFTVKKWGVFDKARPLTVRADFPLFLNRPPYGNPQYANLRYVIGINRVF